MNRIYKAGIGVDEDRTEGSQGGSGNVSAVLGDDPLFANDFFAVLLSQLRRVVLLVAGPVGERCYQTVSAGGYFS